MESILAILVAVIVAVAHAGISNDPRVIIKETVPESDSRGLVRGVIANDVTLNCFVENKPPDKDVRWQLTRYDRDGNIRETLSISRDMGSEDVNKWSIEKPTDYSWRLRIKAIQITDEGTYSCFIQLTIDTKVLDTRAVAATDIPLIIQGQTSSDTTVRQGERHDLMCNASGRPIPTLRWRREGNAILPGGGVELYANKMIIENVRAQHRGKYYCEAFNEMGTATRSIQLSVQYPPIVKADDNEVSQKTGYKRTLICYVDANPQPSADPGKMELSWTRNSRSVEYDSRVYTRVLEGARGLITYELVFWPVQSGDFDDYLCRAKNSLGGPNEVAFTLTEDSEPQRDKGFISGATSATYVPWVSLVSIATVYVVTNLR